MIDRAALWLTTGLLAAGEAEPQGQEPGGDYWYQTAQAFVAWVRDLLGTRFQGSLLGIEYWQYIGAFLAVFLGLALKKISDYLFDRYIIPATKRTRFKFDQLLAEAVSKPLGVALLLVGIFTGVAFLVLQVATVQVRQMALQVVEVALAVDLLWFILRLVDVLAAYLHRVAAKTESKLDDQLVPIIKKSLKVFVGLLVFVMVVQNLGYNVSSLLAGLGIGGLAVAMAAKDTLANFFGGLVIFSDRPFRLGDWVKVGNVEGTVERIGFRSTRIRTFPKTLVTIPNSKIADEVVDNMAAMPARRVRTTVGVTYETTASQMETLLEDLKAILRRDEGVDQECLVVRFVDFGGSSLDVLLQYFTKPTAYDAYLEVVERVNLAVMRAIEARGLSIAFPTRTVYFEGDVARGLAGRAAGESPTK